MLKHTMLTLREKVQCDSNPLGIVNYKCNTAAKTTKDQWAFKEHATVLISLKPATEQMDTSATVTKISIVSMLQTSVLSHPHGTV